jgi:signal peptide peptidase SppA
MMRAFQPHLVSAILTEPWAIYEKVVSDYAPIVLNILNKDVVFDAGEPVLPSAISVNARNSAGSVSSSSDPVNVSVITIAGPLTKNDQFCGPAGTKSIGNWIKQADKDPSIGAIVLNIDSPGGTVNGTEELGNIIRQTKKPIIAFVEDMAASAAYWLAAACDEIIANNSTAQVGSIGVLTSFMDMQPALELQGYKFHLITAPQSTDKVKTWQQLRSGNYEEYKENVLKPLAQKFIDSVKSDRPSAEEKHFTADIYFAQDVVGSLIDKIGNFDSAVSRAAELSLTSAYLPNPNTKLNMNKPDLKRLAKASGVPTLESVDGSITLTAEQAVAVEGALEAHETSNATLSQKVTDSSNQQARVTELEGQLQTANERIAELEKDPAETTADLNKETDANGGGVNDESFFERLGRLSNQNK